MSDATPHRETRSSKAVAIPLLVAGQIVAGYQVSALVGKGGMGEVYRARQLSMDREVALKVLAPRLAVKDPSFAKRFVDEARAAGKLNHPNIIHVHDVGTAALPDGREVHFFSMEFIDGETVQDLLDRDQRLDRKRVAQIMEGVAEALAFAAKAGIVHRDIKPDNLMITKGGLVKLADLGLATPSQTGDAVPERDEKGRAKVMGTPLYLSPEQARALPVDHRSDQYSLGATLFHFLTGDAPYRGPDAKSIMKSHVVDPVPDPADRADDVDEAWRQLCMRLMAKKPEERFATAKELVEAVEAAGEGTTIEQLERRKRGFHVPPHVRMWAFIALGAVVVLLAFIILLRQGGGRPADPPADPPAPPVVQPGGPAVQPSTGSALDLAPFDKAVAEHRLADAQRLLAAVIDQKSPTVVAAAARLATARTEARKALAAGIAAAKAEELDGILAAAGPTLPDEDRPWLIAALDARRAELAPAKPAAPTDDDRWRDLLRQLDKARAGLAFDEVRTSIEKAAGGFATAEAKAAVAELAPLSPLAQSGEMALRAYIGAAQPHAIVALGGKNVDVLLNRLSRTEVFYIVQKDGAPGAEQRAERTKIGMPWPVLLDDALKDQGIEHAPQVKAASLWMWGLPEARAAFTAIKDAPLTKAVAELEKHRK